jgi:uncharacterized membrane protein YhaH (DUF805 family)
MNGMGRSRRQQFFNWLPVLVLGAIPTWIWTLRASHIAHPPVGFYIGVLAFVAGVVTIWPPDHPWVKAGWFLVFGAFLVLEITTLYQQRAEDCDFSGSIDQLRR